MKKKKSIFTKIMSLLFLLFISLYIAQETGYYESKIAKKATLTEEAIKRFESDVKNGVEIDLDSYVVNESTDYSNNTTDMGIFIGSKVERIMSTGLEKAFNVLKSLVT